MTYRAIATDYDGTLASEGRVDPATVDALRRARAVGVCLLLVTGREVSDLVNAFTHVDLFDRVVAENGAVLFVPESRSAQALGPPPPQALVERLILEKVPVSIGQSILATVEPHEQAVLAAIHDLGLAWHVIVNKGAIMALPAHVTKATGLVTALAQLGIAASDTMGVGDAENDQAFLQACGLAVAVANALPAVKAIADIVTVGSSGAGVVEIIDRLLAGEITAPRARQRRGN